MARSTSHFETKLSALKRWELHFTFAIFYLIALKPSLNNCDSMDIRWVDYTNETLPEKDPFFDRIVAIVYNGPFDDGMYVKNRTLIAPGVLFNKSFVLTSMNPFRKYLRNKTAILNVTVDVLSTRYVQNDLVTGYQFEKYYMGCARQVIPEIDRVAEKDKVSDEESPLHDLMVIRLEGNVTFMVPDLSSDDYYEDTESNSFRVGPVITEVATKVDKLGQAVKFASFGYRNEEEMMEYCCLHHSVYSENDNVVTACGDWMPIGWGHFICIRNVDDYAGVGSGAMLFHQDKLYGVGSFLMGRKGESVLVFTDVRQYYDLIHQTCT